MPLPRERDPAQRRNLLAERPEVAERMAGMLRELEARHLRADLDASQLDTEKLEALRALGSVQGVRRGPRKALFGPGPCG